MREGRISREQKIKHNRVHSRHNSGPAAQASRRGCSDVSAGEVLKPAAVDEHR